MMSKIRAHTVEHTHARSYSHKHSDITRCVVMCITLYLYWVRMAECGFYICETCVTTVQK